MNEIGVWQGAAVPQMGWRKGSGPAGTRVCQLSPSLSFMPTKALRCQNVELFSEDPVRLSPKLCPKYDFCWVREKKEEATSLWLAEVQELGAEAGARTRGSRLLGSPCHVGGSHLIPLGLGGAVWDQGLASTILVGSFQLTVTYDSATASASPVWMSQCPLKLMFGWHL